MNGSGEKRAANALGGKTARACDGCLNKRARWFCAADDAFLCQACDASVHSANPLAQRHERLRLKAASLQHHHQLKPSPCPCPSPSAERDVGEKDSLPAAAWHQGFRRKARTPRHSKPNASAAAAAAPPPPPPPSLLQLPNTNTNTNTKTKAIADPLVVPELGGDELHTLDDNEDQLLYRVPIFDPLLAEFCTTSSSSTMQTAATPAAAATSAADAVVQESKPHVVCPAADALPGFLPSDVDLAEFAADVESLLGTGMDEDSFCMQGLGLLDSKELEEGERSWSLEKKKARVVKVKEEEEEEGVVGLAVCHVDAELDLARDTLDLNFDYVSTGEEEEEEAKVKGYCSPEGGGGGKDSKRMSLRLNYDAVITAWASHGSPWTNGHRPQLNPDDCWPDFMSTCGSEFRQYGGEMVGGHVTVGDGGREARVSRYREKRRTRLFSKKIRYEVRKLNAEKRPRMKGRFVKRASFAGSAFPF